MSTSEKDKCKRCGAVIPAKSTDKLCPACLMSGAMEPPGHKDDTVSMTSGEALLLHGPSEFPKEFGGYRLLGLLGRGFDTGVTTTDHDHVKIPGFTHVKEE